MKRNTVKCGKNIRDTRRELYSWPGSFIGRWAICRGTFHWFLLKIGGQMKVRLSPHGFFKVVGKKCLSSTLAEGKKQESSYIPAWSRRAVCSGSIRLNPAAFSLFVFCDWQIFNWIILTLQTAKSLRRRDLTVWHLSGTVQSSSWSSSACKALCCMVTVLSWDVQWHLDSQWGCKHCASSQWGSYFLRCSHYFIIFTFPPNLPDAG